MTPVPAVSSSRHLLASPRLPSLPRRSRAPAPAPARQPPPPPAGWALGPASRTFGARRSAAWLAAPSPAARAGPRAPLPAARAPRRPGPAAAARAAAAASSRSSSGRRGAPRTCTFLSSPCARSLLPQPLLHQLTPRERMTSSLPFQLPPLPPRLGRGEKKEGLEEGPGPRGSGGRRGVGGLLGQCWTRRAVERQSEAWARGISESAGWI